MSQNSKFSNTFIESLTSCAEEERLRYLQLLFQVPEKVRTLIFARETPSFIKGLLRSYDVPGSNIDAVSLSIIRVFVGEKSLAQLPAILSTELKLPNDKAQKMAAEIEKDVFWPVKVELDEFLRQQKAKAGSIAGKLSATPQTPSRSPSYEGEKTRPAPRIQNVLNLKEINAPKRPTALPGRPVQKDFPVRTKTTYLTPASPSKGEETTRRPSPYEGEGKGDEVRKPSAPKFPLPPKPIRFT